MSVVIDTSSVPLTWANASNSTWAGSGLYDWTAVPQSLFELTSSFSLAIAETYLDQISFNLNVSETLSLVEVLGNHGNLTFPEVFSIVSNTSSYVQKSLTDLLSISENLQTTSLFIRKLIETIELLDNMGGHRYISFSEVFSIVSNISPHIQKNLIELLDISENLQTTSLVIKNLIETLGISDILMKESGISLVDGFSILSDTLYHTQKNLIELLDISEDSKTASLFVRKLIETLGISETLIKDLDLSLVEALVLIDDFLKNYAGVLSDLIISSTTIDSIEEFEDIILNGRAPGFSNFRSFIQGDYTYTEALFKAILTSEVANGRTELSQMVIDVDLPDIIETGTATITVAADGIPVSYDKIFRIIPEVTLSYKGGAAAGIVAIPEIVKNPEGPDPDETGFTVKLKNPTLDSYIEGTITWAAHGY